jgi:hypothetical protein
MAEVKLPEDVSSAAYNEVRRTHAGPTRSPRAPGAGCARAGVVTTADLHNTARPPARPQAYLARYIKSKTLTPEQLEKHKVQLAGARALRTLARTHARAPRSHARACVA